MGEFFSLITANPRYIRVTTVPQQCLVWLQQDNTCGIGRNHKDGGFD